MEKKEEKIIEAKEGNEAIKHLTKDSIGYINENKNFAKHINRIISSRENEFAGIMRLKELHLEPNYIGGCFPYLKIWGIWPIHSFLNVIDTELDGTGGSEAATVMVNEVRVKLEEIEETLERLEREARGLKAIKP